MHQQTPKQRAVESARYQRSRQTNAEDVFWQSVRGRQFCNLKFLRQQHPIYYELDNIMKFVIVDFYCHEKKSWLLSWMEVFTKVRKLMIGKEVCF